MVLGASVILWAFSWQQPGVPMLSLLERPCCVHTNAIALKWSRLSPDGPNLLLYMHQDSVCCSTLLRHGCHLYCRFLVVANTLNLPMTMTAPNLGKSLCIIWLYTKTFPAAFVLSFATFTKNPDGVWSPSGWPAANSCVASMPWSNQQGASFTTKTPFHALLQEIKLGEKQRIEALFERAVHLQLPPKKMKFLFKRYLQYEQEHGDATAVANVKKQALDFVQQHMWMWGPQWWWLWLDRANQTETCS